MTTMSRRMYRRRTVQLEVSISFKPSPAVVTAKPARGLTLVGRTRDLSENGLAVIVSAHNIDRYLKRPENSFGVQLKLPNGAVDFQATPLYFKRFSVGGVVNYLIGSRISDVDKSSLARLVTYLRSLPPT